MGAGLPRPPRRRPLALLPCPCVLSEVDSCPHSVPGPCEPEDLIDGIIFAANYLGSTQLLSERNPSKNIRMMQAQEAVSRVKVWEAQDSWVPYREHWRGWATWPSIQL